VLPCKNRLVTPRWHPAAWLQLPGTAGSDAARRHHAGV